MAIASVNPATGEVLRTFDPLGEAEIDLAIRVAAETFPKYRLTSFADRAERLMRAAQILEAEKEELGRLMTSEMGKPLRAAIEEAAKCATACRYYAENGERLLRDQEIATSASRSFVRFQPLGPVLAIMPWNFPMWQVFRFAAPALMAGNVGLLKHASNVPQCALKIEDILIRAGFDDGVFQTLLIGSDAVERILTDERVKAATLTGSEPAGSKVAATCGKVIKKTVLELGGSDPFIVMPSANLVEAVATAVRARTINNGQSCIAAKRFIVHERVYDEFERRFVERMRALKVGDPMSPDTDVGPLATKQIRDDLDAQVHRAIKAGARVLLGGKRMDPPGWFYEPTVLVDVPRATPVYYQEIFGPVAMLFRVRNTAEAISIANDTPFGLAASAWTNNAAERDAFIDELEAGMVFINGMVASDARLPFGGVKHSGYGRELGPYGILEFMNIKTVWIKDAAEEPRTATE
jgi:succinate-semialdehyde dehydrogenase/glutarate-semialdehyde dehydrogenase